MNRVHDFLAALGNAEAGLGIDEALAPRTTFRIGGPADLLVLPRTSEALTKALDAARASGLDCAVIGGGANLLVADAGVRGIVVSTTGMHGVAFEEAPDGSTLAHADAGCPIAWLAEEACRRGLAGLEFAAGLPGSSGGAVYMNARCYDAEIADVLASVRYVDRPRATLEDMVPDRGAWSYKRTPFMPGGPLAGAVVARASFRLVPGDPDALAARMSELKADRVRKGHFDYPSAGSMFKNDRAFGRPTGALLDELGFRGRRIGDAMVSPKHANIFVNAGKATAADMLSLVELAREEARKAFGFELEPEVVFLGDGGFGAA